MGMDVQTDTSGLDGLMGRLAGADKVVRQAAFQVQANAQKEIQTGTKSGRIYKRGKKTHQASGPGEAPASDSSLLANSILAGKVRDCEWEVRVGAEYGGILELIRNRAFIGPALAKVEKSFEAAVRKLVSG